MNNVFSPTQIGQVKLSNRFVVPPLVCFSFADPNGFVSYKNLKHYDALSKGGSGLVIVEATCVSEQGRLSEDQLGIWSDDFIAGLSQIAKVCHENGCKVFIQIHHAGSKSFNPNSISSSDYNNAHAASLEEIQKVKEDFVNAAIRSEKAGFDGIELHGAHGYLLTQFFSKEFNKRTDAYGGSFENEMRLVTEIFQDVKLKVQDNFVVGIRMGCNESGIQNSIKMAKYFETLGFDYLHLSTGIDGTPIEKPDEFPGNWIVYGATQVKKNVQIPVIAVNSLTPELANYLIQNELVDLVAFGKAQLADYQFANHLMKNEPVVECIHCQPCRWYRNGEKCPKNKVYKEI